jgi:hypothetical protein
VDPRRPVVSHAAWKFATSPIRSAIESGFHSLVEVLLRDEAVDQQEKNDALIRAIDSRNFDLVEPLMQYGADPRGSAIGTPESKASAWQGIGRIGQNRDLKVPPRGWR